ncbi:MAG: cell division protein FtsQ/DivIB, partial [Candidatus Binatia bacterium]
MCVGTFLALHEWREQIRSTFAVGRQFIFDNGYFSVRQIQVHGGEKVGGNEIIAMAGLRQGMNIWNIDPTAIEKRIAKHPWVRRVLVRRDFPRRVVIDVEERQPKAIVAMGKLYYVDTDGVLFTEVAAGENVQFPMLTGLRAEELATSNPTVRRRIQDALRLGDLMTQDSHALSEIHFDAPDRLVLYTMAHPVALRMGWGAWEAKRQRLNRVLTLWKGKEERLASLDVSFRDQVVI